MKKIIPILAVIIMICMSHMAYAADSKVICDENFEEYKIGDKPKGWSASVDSEENGTYFQVEEDPNDPSNKCLAIHGNNKDEINNYFYFDEPIGGMTTIELRVRMGNSEKNVHWIAWMHNIFNNMLYQNSFTMITGEGTKVMNNFNADYTKWYDIKYEIDFLNHTFNYYFDGNLIHENMIFQNPDMNQVAFMEFRLSYNTTYIDDIKINMTGGITKVYTKLDIDGADYKYSAGQRTMQNVFDETTVDNFMKHFTFVDGADYGLYEADGETPYNGTYVKNGMKLVISSPDKLQKSEITVYTRKRFFGTSTARTAKNAAAFAVDSEYALLDNVRTLIDENNPSLKCFKENGEIYVPLRKLTQAFGIPIEWDNEKKCAVVDGKICVENINLGGTMFIPISQAESITGKRVIYNDGTLAVIRANDLSMRSSLRKTVMNELYLRLTAE